MKYAALVCLLFAAPAMAQMPPQQGAPQQQQMPPSIGYKLTMQPIETCHKAMMTLLQRARTDAAIRAEQERTEQPEGDTVDQIVNFMKKQAPASTAMMVANGCPPDQYVKIGFATAEAAMALQMIEQKGPTNTLTPIARENAAFIKANATRLQQIDSEADAAEAAAGLQGAQQGGPQGGAQPGGAGNWTPPGGTSPAPQRR
ncbi:hypothetical protein [Roseiterribacter gracilis]|uniref:DUF4168 domain-containing protein n=1 Tax=Roseiterribacter gracilis TaxID=2812848 RepID=A0A8S8XB99_9PROT|nr:hypothetical protein TMPK1_06730 [Rhodospirillales bacterium TMPK1]